MNDLVRTMRDTTQQPDPQEWASWTLWMMENQLEGLCSAVGAAYCHHGVMGLGGNWTGWSNYMYLAHSLFTLDTAPPIIPSGNTHYQHCNSNKGSAFLPVNDETVWARQYVLWADVMGSVRTCVSVSRNKSREEPSVINTLFLVTPVLQCFLNIT